MESKPETVVAGGGLVFNERDELLMIFRRGVWDLPKGKLDEGETIEACALREVTEETGVSGLRVRSLLGITHHQFKYQGRPALKETHWFIMDTTSQQKLVPQAEEDIERIEWVNAASLPQFLAGSFDNIRQIVGKSGFGQKD